MPIVDFRPNGFTILANDLGKLYSIEVGFECGAWL